MAWLHLDGDRTHRAVSSSLATMVAFPSSVKECSCSACCFFCQESIDAFSPCLPAYVLVHPLQSIFCILSLGYHRLFLGPARLTKQGASLLTTMSLWTPLWTAGGVEGRSKQDGRGSNAPFL